ncbi:hypothetical protein [uncultured Flavobacterium sp.]|uniref:hypothetical protein n=1 Tax=uncultured Flavobacterium sp. TaxID=165435 RepID=UPI0025E582E0|nr:hypothetical protein [uncultured Flavobacterium sp.]
MKFRTSYIIALFIFFISFSATAQVDRRIGSSQYKRDRKANNADFVQQSVDYLTKELKLDDFQKAALREVLEDERDHITELRSAGKDVTRDEVRDRAKAISDRVYKKVLPILSKDQADIYTKMEESKKF